MLINLGLVQNSVLGREKLVLWDEEVGSSPSSGSSVPTHPIATVQQCSAVYHYPLAASAPVQCSHPPGALTGPKWAPLPGLDSPPPPQWLQARTFSWGQQQTNAIGFGTQSIPSQHLPDPIQSNLPIRIQSIHWQHLPDPIQFANTACLMNDEDEPPSWGFQFWVGVGNISLCILYINSPLYGLAMN